MKLKSSIAIIIPAYNAEKTIGQLLEKISKYISLKNVIVINDGSLDNTANIIKKTEAIILEHSNNSGKGAALKTGIKYILTQNYEAIIILDADLQHNPDTIPEFIRIWQETEADIVLGNRMHNISSMPLARIFSNRTTSFFVSWRAKNKIPDSQCGYRLLTRKVLETIKLEDDGYLLETELLIKAGRNGFNFAFVPIETIYNDEKSYINHLKVIIKFIKIILRSLKW